MKAVLLLGGLDHCRKAAPPPRRSIDWGGSPRQGWQACCVPAPTSPPCCCRWVERRPWKVWKPYWRLLGVTQLLAWAIQLNKFTQPSPRWLRWQPRSELERCPTKPRKLAVRLSQPAVAEVAQSVQVTRPLTPCRALPRLFPEIALISPLLPSQHFAFACFQGLFPSA